MGGKRKKGCKMSGDQKRKERKLKKCIKVKDEKKKG